MKKDKWTSDFGFLMAASGSAVGLGNLWKFPYIAGSNGGAVFLIIYFVLLIILGMPVLLSEMTIGRFTRKNPIDACKTIHSKWGFAGAFGIIGAFIILCYYGIIGGWIIRYLISYITHSKINEPEVFFNTFAQSPISPILFHFLFTAICASIVMRGVSGGIEKISKFFMPALLVMMIFLTIKSLSLDGAINGVKFFLVPNTSELSTISDWLSVFTSAMGQVFFSLSLGMGTLITYGAYLDKKTSITKCSIYIPLIDFAIALLAGLMILPAVFAYNISPSAGSGMIFIALPQVFNKIGGGQFFGVVFFILVLFAAITSAISLIEVIVSYLMEKFKIKRSTSAILCVMGISLFGIPTALSFSIIKNFKIFGMNFFDLLNFISDKVLMPLGALSICILCGYIWNTKNVANEANIKNSVAKKIYGTSIRYIAPIMIIIIFISSFF